jgi:hypothetical protein
LRISIITLTSGELDNLEDGEKQCPDDVKMESTELTPAGIDETILESNFSDVRPNILAENQTGFGKLSNSHRKLVIRDCDVF